MLQPYKCYALCYLQEKHLRLKSVVVEPKMLARKSFFRIYFQLTNEILYNQ